MKDKYSVTHMWNIKKVNKPNQTKANTQTQRPDKLISCYKPMLLQFF